MTPIAVSGFAEGRFEPLADIFGRLVGNIDGAGAALCIYQRGRPVVDLVGGTYAPDTLQLLFSVTKGITATAVGTTVERGEIDPDEPLADFWPEFRRPDVDGVTLRQVLSHRSGLAGLTAPVTFDELLAGADLDLVAKESPFWQPGTAQGYHPFTYGSLVEGVFRRKLGRSVAEVVQERISGALGLDLWVGAPAEVHDRIAPVVMEEPRITRLAAEHPRMPDTAFGAILSEDDVFNTAALRSAPWAAISGIADARSLARMLAATLWDVDGIRLFGDAVRADLTSTRSHEIDRAFGVEFRFGTGYQLPFPQLPMLGPASFGHEGAGGSVMIADPDLDLTMAFTTNAFGHMTGASVEALAILSSVRHCASPTTSAIHSASAISKEHTR